MNTQEDQRNETMSFSLWALACRVIPQPKGLPQTQSGQARMHPQSKGDPVLRLHSCRALSPVPRPEHEGASPTCHLQN
jgi:hypothetical protein